MLDIQLQVDALLVKWVKAFLEKKNQPWRPFVDYTLRRTFSPFVHLTSTIFASKLPTNNKFVHYNNLSPLWHSIFNAWYRMNGRLSPSPSPSSTLNAPLWFSTFIPTSQRPAKSHSSLAKLGILQLGHLMQNIPPITTKTLMLTTARQTLLESLPPSISTTLYSTWSPDWVHSDITLNDVGVGKGTSFVPLSEYTSKKGYLSGSSTDIVIVHKWNLYFSKDLNWKQIWRRITSNKIIRLKGKDLLFNIVSDRIYLRGRVSRWKPGVPEHCFGCRSRETSIHLFIECSAVDRLWNWVKGVWNAAVGQNIAITAEKVFTGFPMGSRKSKSSGKAILWANIYVEVMWAIWTERNRCSFNNGSFSYQSILAVLKYNLRDTLKALQQKFPTIPEEYITSLQKDLVN